MAFAMTARKVLQGKLRVGPAGTKQQWMQQIQNLDPTSFRAKIQEAARYTAYNIGTTVAYITIICGRPRFTLNSARPAFILATIPKAYNYGPMEGSGNTPSAATTAYSWTTPGNFNPLRPDDANYSTFWKDTMSVAIFGVTGSSGFSANFALRTWHAKQQFNPWVLDCSTLVTGGDYGSGGAGLSSGPWGYGAGGGSATGSSPWVNQAYVSSFYDGASNADASSNQRESGKVFSAFGADLGYANLPTYKEEMKGPFDAMFRRWSKRIVLHPGQSYRFTIKDRPYMINPMGDGYWPVSHIAIPAVNTQAMDNMGSYWKASDVASVYPTFPYLTRRGHSGGKTDSRYVTFIVRGNTSVTSAGAVADLVQEAGPAALMIKRQYKARVGGYFKRPRRMRAVRASVNGNDTDSTAADYVNMYPTAVPATEHFTTI